MAGNMSTNANAYRHPFRGIIGALANKVANSRWLATLRHAVVSRLPFVALESDVVDVVYLTWLVDVTVAQDFVPAGVQLWQRGGKTPFTVLTYRHGHFGPAFFGPLRRIFPSPLQSNWRFYVEGRGAAARNTIFFCKNILDSAPYALGARVFSDVLQPHLAARFRHRRTDGGYETEMHGGEGSSPSLKCVAQLSSAKELSAAFAAVFESWEEAVSFLSNQDEALALVERTANLASSEISLPIKLAEVQALSTADQQVSCSMLEHFGGVSEPFCFLVPRVKFRVLTERLVAARCSGETQK